MDKHYKKIFEGENIKIFAVKFGEKCHYIEFLNSLSEIEKTSFSKKRDNLFKLYDLKKGNVLNKEKLRKLKFQCDSCFEFKVNQIRISFVKGENEIFLLDAFKKKSGKWPKNKIRQTEKICLAFNKTIEGG